MPPRKAAPKTFASVDEELDAHLGAVPRLTPVRWRLSTGLTMLDLATGGGYASGHATEIWGDAGIGKTLLALMAAAEVQSAGGKAYYWDTEQSLSAELATLVGITIDEGPLWSYRPYPIVEKVIDGIEMVSRARKGTADPTLHVWDSVPGGSPSVNHASERPVWDGKKEEGPAPKVAERAALLHRFFERGCLHEILASPIWILMINQIRDDIGARYAGQTMKAGGRAMKYGPCMSIKVEEDGKITGGADGKKTVGSLIKATVTKTKFGPRYNSARFPFYYDTGVGDVRSVVDYLYDNKVLQVNGAYMVWNGKSYYREALSELAADDPACWTELKDMATVHYRGGKK